jgi:selenocysteine lyase/cysteine desulfurase
MNQMRRPPRDASLRGRIVGVDQQVPVLGGGRQPYVSLDNAASTPVLREVLETVNRFMDWYSSVHRGAGFKSQVSTRAYEEARGIVADFVGASRDDHVVIFGKNASEAINKVSWRLNPAPDDVVLVSQMEHHSNDLPWRAQARVEHIGVDDSGALDLAHLDSLLRRHAGRVRLVAVTGASNVTGYMPDIHALARRAHAAGAQILVDCAQLAPHRRIDMRGLDDPSHLDYVTLSAHKMYAPFGTGALIGRRDTFEQGEPEHRGGGTIDFVGLDSVTWAPAPDRDEAGTPNVVGAVALAAAIMALSEIGMDQIAAHEAELRAHALNRLARIDGIRLCGTGDAPDAHRHLGVIAFTLSGQPHGLVAAVLAAEYGIGVRNGCFCAHPYLIRLLGLSQDEAEKLRASMADGDRSAVPGLVRISFGMYNSTDDIDRLAVALERIAAGRIGGTYRQDADSGDYIAEGLLMEPAEAFSIARQGLAIMKGPTAGVRG